MAEIYLIDGSSIVYRSYYAIPKLTTSTGIQTNAILGFFNTLFKYLKKHNIQYIAIFFDMKKPTLRHEKFDAYKIKRKPMPDELSSQIPLIKEILKYMGIKYFEKEGYEADDIIATFTEKFKNNHKIFIITGDKDALQLVGETVKVINPANGEIKDIEYLRKKYNLTPEKIVDLLALAGDTSDNIPGIPGIGEKTALSLLSTFSSVEDLYKNVDKVKSEKLRKKIIENKEIAFLSKELVKLHKNINIEINLDDIKISRPDFDKLREIFTRLEFNRLKEQMYQIFPEAGGKSISENKIAFSTGEIIDFNEIIKTPDTYKSILSDENIEIYGFHLKNKLSALFDKNIVVKSRFFDISLAEYLTGKAVSGDNIFEIVKEYKKTLKEMKIETLYYEIELPLIYVLIWMEKNGIKVDTEYLNNLSMQLEEKLKKLENQIFAEAGEMFNINSPQQLSKILFEKLKLPPKKKLKTTYSTDTTVLKELSNLHPLPKLLLEYRELSKLKSTYIDGLIPFIKNGRIHPTFNQISTTTGRLSCSNPNLQNIPIRTETGSKVRKIFCSENGYSLFSFDYNQIELRVLAHFSKDKYLLNAFRNGKDIHSETGQLLFSENTLFSPAFSNFQGEQIRRIAKTINFGIIYGISPYGLSQQLGIPASEAKFFIDSYFEKFKGVKKYIEETIKKVEKNGYVETLFGRRRYIPEIKSMNKNLQEFAKRAAINMPIQGTSADIIKLAMVKIYDNFKKNGMRSKMVLQIHDELVFEVKEGEEEKVCKIVKEIMESCVKLDVPVKVDVKKGRNYLEMKNL